MGRAGATARRIAPETSDTCGEHMERKEIIFPLSRLRLSGIAGKLAAIPNAYALHPRSSAKDAVNAGIHPSIWCMCTDVVILKDGRAPCPQSMLRSWGEIGRDGGQGFQDDDGLESSESRSRLISAARTWLRRRKISNAEWRISGASQPQHVSKFQLPLPNTSEPRAKGRRLS